MTLSKLTLAVAVTFFSTALFAQDSKKTQTTKTETTATTPVETANSTEPAVATDTTKTETTTTEESKDDKDENKSGLFIEPMLTYQQADLTLTYPAPFTSSSKEDVDGPGVGLRFGGHIYEFLFLAADMRYSKPKYKSSALNSEADATAYNAGLTLGVQTPVAGLRVWGTYLLAGELDPEKMGAVDGKFQEQKGYRVGVGLYVKVVSINLEYEDSKYDKIEINDGTTVYNNLIKPEQKSYIVSVSFPIAL